MTFNEFQTRCMETAIYPAKGSNIAYTTLGLCGEAGEVAEKVKKLYRDNNGIKDDKFVLSISKELADVMWYVAAVAYEANLTLEDIIDIGLAKYASRKERGVLHGDGDDR